MKNFKQVLLMVFIFMPGILFAQQNKHFIGSWMGRLSTGGIQLRLGINLSVDSTGKLTALLDSPDQKVFGIKTDSTIVSGDQLIIKAKKMMASYEGTIIRGDSLINGKWTQAGKTFDLNLKKMTSPEVLKRPQEPKPPFPYKKMTSPEVLKRPQEPKPPFPYISKDVTFINAKANIELSGTLTIPEGKGPFRAVILVTGSGPQDRNETLLGHKPFLVIADYLTRKGIAVLRYDDRGIGKSKGNYATATSFDFADDAEAGLIWLRNQPLIDSKHFGIAGHSEGGLIAPIVASRNKNVNFIVLLAGPGISGEEIILAQSELIGQASGLSRDVIDESLSLNKKIFAEIKNEKDDTKALAEARKIMEDAINSSTKLSDTEKSNQKKGIDATIAPLTSPWFRTFIQFDPKPYLSKTKCPVLALNGTKDLQVPYKVDLESIEKCLKIAGNKNFSIMKIEGVNHLFQHTEKGLPSEYGTIEETFAPEALKAMSDFILKLK